MLKTTRLAEYERRLLPRQPSESPFVELPTSHGAYASVTALQRESVLEAYPRDYFSGRRILTRYEFAVATKRMLDGLFGARKENSPPLRLSGKVRTLLLELLDEFRKELRTLGATKLSEYERWLRSKEDERAGQKETTPPSSDARC
jgi:hypothetical protein